MPEAAEITPELTADAVRALLRETALIIKPGEVLVLRSRDFTAAQAHGLQEALAERELGFKVLVVPGDELAVAQPESDEAFAARVARALHQNSMRGRFPRRPVSG